MGKKIGYLFIIGLILVLPLIISTINPGHDPSEIGSGTFAGGGDYIFPSNIKVPFIYDYNNNGYYVNPDENSWLYRLYSYDVRSSIFYDQDNTGYYVDPASTSKFNNLILAGKASCSGKLYTDSSGNILCGTDSSGISCADCAGSYVDVGGDTMTGTLTVPYISDSDYYADPNGNSWLYRIYSYDVRSPIYYDLDNTGYYLDSNSNSNLNNVYANMYYYSSDITLKKNIQNLSNALENIQKLQGVKFEWKDTGEKSIGLIAQDVEKVFPELVSTNNELKSIQYGNLVAVLVESVKEQQKQIDELKKEIKKLKEDEEI